MVYRFLILSDEDESFMREFEFLDSQTLLDFHNMIQDELEFDRSQLASFYTTSDNWEKEEEFTLFDMGGASATMEDAILEEVICKDNQKMAYVFDFFNERSLFIEYIGESEEKRGVDYPTCVSAKGPAPKQILFGTSKKKSVYQDIDSSTDDDDDDVIPESDDLYISDEDEQSLPNFDNDDIDELLEGEEGDDRNDY